jgi:hypothetical protein
MRTGFLKSLSVSLLIVLLLMSNLNAQIPDPKTFFGFTPGDDRQMFNYEKLMEYMFLLEKSSPLVDIEQSGKTEFGKPMYIIFISSESNIQALPRLRDINRQLALDEIPEGVSPQSLIEEGRVFYLSTLSMHATEVGPMQALPVIAYEMIMGTDERLKKILESSVAMFIPHNPDGLDMIVEHYYKYKGTPLETSSMPGVYNKYVGHNINRDFVTLTQSENQMVAGVYSTDWFPQVMVERHQMGSSGPRFYISPPHDPIAENVDAELWNWVRIFGSRAMHDMTSKGMEGVSVNYLFDDYWPGATTTGNWKGVIGMLSEAASVHLASPIFIEENELRFSGKGLSDNSISINFPKPWPGGWWRLSDIVSYEKENTISNLYTAAIHKDELLTYRHDVTLREINRGKTQAPYFYVLPQKQSDQSEWVAIVNLLDLHGVEVFSLTKDVVVNNRQFLKGDIVVPLSQPYRPFVKEVLEKQKFPVRYYTPGGEMIRPYDITSWSLPLHRGVDAVEINEYSSLLSDHIEPVAIPFIYKSQPADNKGWALFSSGNNESFKLAFVAAGKGIKVERTQSAFESENTTFPAGSFLVPVNDAYKLIEKDLAVSPVYFNDKPGVAALPVKLPRVAIVETWFHDMDAGWLRYIFDQYGLPYTVLRPADLQQAKLQRDFDMLFFTDRPKSLYMSGKYEREGKTFPLSYPPEYSKGMEKKGMENLLSFINNGGKVMAWGPSVELFTGTLAVGEESSKEEFVLPFENIGKSLASKGLYVPGSLLRVRLHGNHPLTWGMPSELGVFHRGTPVFRTSIPDLDMDRRVIASFTDDNILMSGYAEKEELLKKEAAFIWLKKGKGQIILSSFNPQFRSSTAVTYKLIFNALLLP